ncbi:MAG: LamG domain-containing protein, partial [Verrucomicrobiales bacterium]
AITIADWGKLRGYGDDLRWGDQVDQAAKIGYACLGNEGHPMFEYWDRDGQNRKCRAPQALDLEKWYHVTFTYDSVRCAIYVDGEICAEDAASPIAAGKRRVRVGAEHADGFHLLNGTIDDLIHYPRALSGEEAQALFKARLANSPVRF